MKQSFKKMLGVTLLEIMLVLAIAALVIVMSIRFYQSASTSNKVNAGVSLVQGIVAAGENYLNATGSFSAISNTTLLPYLPGSAMPTSPWGGDVTVKSTGANSYTIAMPVTGPQSVCTQFNDLLKQNAKFTPDNCAAAGKIEIGVVS